MAVCELDCLVLNLGTEVVGEAALGADPIGEHGLGVVKESVLRLRALLGERAGLVVVLPGPLDLAAYHGRTPSDGELEDLASSLLKVAGHLDPPSFDALGVLETGPVGGPDAERLAGVLSVLWNVARYYAMPSLFAAVRPTRRWEGSGPPRSRSGGDRSRRPGQRRGPSWCATSRRGLGRRWPNAPAAAGRRLLHDRRRGPGRDRGHIDTGCFAGGGRSWDARKMSRSPEGSA